MVLSSRRSTKASGNRTVTLLALWAVIIMAAGGFAAAAMFTSNRAADPYAQCQSSVLKATATIAVLVDATDVFTEDQRRRLKTTIEGERDRLPLGGRLIILRLNPDAPWEPSELITVCNPGKAEDTNPFLVTRSKIEKRWQTSFADPIEQAIAISIDSAASERSPIIITLAAMLARADFDTRVPARRLVIISDLLEHDKSAYSQLRGGDFWSAYQASSLPKSTRLDLHGVSVAIDYLQRGKFSAIQGPRHQAFWQRLLKEAGSSEVNFLGMSSALTQAQTEPTPTKGKR
mgnify:CR=1 FL=1